MKIVDYLPLKLRNEVMEYENMGLEEIRIRAGMPVQYIFSDEVKIGIVLGMEDISEIINYMSDYSLHTIERQLYDGFFTVDGGHRIGVTGVTGHSETGICSIVNISSLNIRIARQIKGVAEPFIDYIRNGDKIYNTLIVSRPGTGKTTCLRDSIRLLSDGNSEHKPLKVAVVDERSEIAACCNGVPQNDIGKSSDVMDNCPKNMGMLMVLRSMSPDVIAVDELGGDDDFRSVDEITYRGVNILGTIHAADVTDLKEKVKSDRFERFITIKKNEMGYRKYDIYDKAYRLLYNYVCNSGSYK